MAHFAEIDKNNIVIRVLVTDTNDPNGDEGYQFLIDTFGGNWIKTSYNTRAGVHIAGGIPLRKNYAGVGFIYDSDLDAFYEPQPYPSWILNEETCVWEAPVPNPDPEKYFYWNEELLTWEFTAPVIE